MNLNVVTLPYLVTVSPLHYAPQIYRILLVDRDRRYRRLAGTMIDRLLRVPQTSDTCSDSACMVSRAIRCSAYSHIFGTDVKLAAALHKLATLLISTPLIEVLHVAEKTVYLWLRRGHARLHVRSAMNIARLPSN